MIDTDKYEGREALRQYLSSASIDLRMKPHFETYEALLAEVERLRSILGNIKDIDMNWGIDFNGATITVTHFTGLMLSGELKLEMIE